MSGAAAAEGGGERGGDARCGTELLVITHEDARFALTTDLDAKRPKDLAAARIRAAVRQVAEVVAANRARRKLYPRMRHPRHDDGGTYGRLLRWPDWPAPGPHTVHTAHAVHLRSAHC